MHFTYIIRCKDDSLYTGYTTSIDRRMEEHKRGINSKYTKSKGFNNLEIYFISNSKSKAMKLESYIKKLSRTKKLWIIKHGNEFINELENKQDYILGRLKDNYENKEVK